MVIIGFCLLFLAAGIWRHQAVVSKVIHPSEEKIAFIGTVAGEPDIRETHTKLTLIDIGYQSIAGKVLATVSRYPEYHYGDKLKITGEIEVPYVFDDFSYKDYLAKDGIYSVMYYPQIELVEKNQGNFVYAKILELKDKLRGVIYQNLSPPQSSILSAMMLGDKSRMSADLKEKLNLAGVRHITAVSGMHITIFSVLLMQILLGLGLWRKHAFYLALAFLTLYIVLVGFPASAVRAGLMGGVFLLARHFGRMSFSLRAVVLTAAGMLAVNPLLLRLDVGFQLSFLAVTGIILLSTAFQRFLKKIPNWFQLRSILAMTLSAQVFTLPILIYNFGYVSPVAPLTNVLIVPLLAFLMGLGLVFVLAGLVFQPLAWLLAWPCWLLLTYITELVNLFSQIFWTSIG